VSEHGDVEALSAYVDGEAPEWGDHVAGCAQCAATVEALRAVSDAVGAPVEPADPALRELALGAALTPPEPAPATPQAMAAWLQDALKLDRPANNLRVERARPVPWSEKGQEQSPLMQPARWTFSFGGPNRVIQIEYWQGNRSASVRTTENGFVATLTNLHKGVGMPVAWVLLIDTLAGSLIFLTLSGVVLWWTTNRRKRVGIAIFGASVALTVGLALWPTTQ